ncbi:unnamed protein product [Owenia fusiformis]|uniref:Uncharacterized protein n=1 Tax=Owenia fusiformis TaxID=6347 RepID=A0A8J1XHW7_OWEFU|nr:unnamed protein product [Owenia fusiformis]
MSSKMETLIDSAPIMDHANRTMDPPPPYVAVAVSTDASVLVNVTYDVSTEKMDVENELEVPVLSCLILVLIIGTGVASNLLVIVNTIRNTSLHRSPFYNMMNLSIAILLRTTLCIPFVLVTMLNKYEWVFGTEGCTLLAFANTLFIFGALFGLFIIAVDRHVAVLHHKFHKKRLKGVACVILVVICWLMSFMMAFPPVFGLGTYRYVKLEAQCTFEHRYYKNNDTLGFMLIYLVILTSVFCIYLRIFQFMRAHRRMRPLGHLPMRSSTWNFFGPGANAQAVATWLNGFGVRMPTNRGVIALQAIPQATQTRMRQYKARRNEKLTRMFLLVTGTFILLWGPYMVMNYWYLFDVASEQSIPDIFISVATWLTYIQVAVTPTVYITYCKTFRKTLMKPRSQHGYTSRRDDAYTENDQF